MPTHAVILAAGLGTRLDPITQSIPKALLSFHGKPLLAWSIDLLQSWGVTDILVNAHAHADQVMSFCRDYASTTSCRLSVSIEPDVLGTGGALRRAAWFLPGEEPFWLMNADIVADVHPQPLVDAMTSSRCIAALWMVPNAGPRTVCCAKKKVVHFRSKDPGGPGTATFSGLHLLRPRILDYLPQTEEFSSILPAYEEAMEKGQWFAAVDIEDSFWADVGTPDQYHHARDAWAKHMKTTGGNNDIDSTAVVKPGGRVKNSLVMAGACIQKRGVVHRAMVAPHTVVGQRGERLLAPMPLVVSREEESALQKLGFEGDASCAEVLSPRGSAREFIRISKQRESVMLIRFDPARKENGFYAGQARRLKKAKLPVFSILAEGRKESFTLVEDLGRMTLLDKVSEASSSLRLAWYRKAVELMHDFHRTTSTLRGRRKLSLMPSFTSGVYGEEHELFTRQFLNRFGYAGAATNIVSELSSVGRYLARQKRVVVHRDYQSTNLMVHQRKLWLIDFQGMRKGPAIHDLASLLLDPYVQLPVQDIETLLAGYGKLLPGDRFTPKAFYMAGIQRLTQALGAFGRLSRIPGCEQYLGYIPPALQHLSWCANEISKVPHLQKWVGQAVDDFST